MLTTIIFFILGIIASYFIARWQMKKNKIVHYLINSYDIGKGLSDEFPEFQLHYAGNKLADNIKVLKGGFMNTGRNDIDGLKGDSDITLILPDECSIKTISVKPSTEELKVNTNKNDSKANMISFGIFDILKSNEYFEYTAIVELSKDKNINNLEDKIKIHHRIYNTDNIRNTVYLGLQRRFQKIKFLKYFIIFSIIIMLLLSFYSMFFQKMEFDVINKGTNQKVAVHITPNSQLYINQATWPFPPISSINITQEEFDNYYEIQPLISHNWLSFKYIYELLVAIFFIVFLTYYYYLFWGRNSHILHVLNENNKNK